MAAQAKAQPDTKVLRIGILQAGKVVHERLIRPGQSVSVGSSPKNTFTLQAANLPKQYTLFQAKGNRYFLNFTDKMAGKIAYRDGIVGLDQLKQGDATRKGPQFVLPLNEKNRGKIVIDDITVLFQFVNAPPESARLVGGQDFRARLIDEDDPVFLGFLALFSSMATVLMIWVINQEPVESVSLEDIPDRFVELVIPKAKEVEIEAPDSTKPAEEAKKEKKPEEKPEEAEAKKQEKPKNLTPEEQAAAEAARLAEKQASLARKSMLIGMLGTRGESNGGSAEDVFSDSDSSFQNLDQALDNVGGAQIAGSGNLASARGQRDGSGREGASIGEVGAVGGGTASVGSAPKVVAKKAAISTSGVETASGEGADAVRGVVRSKSGQVKYCYEQRLKENPNITGRIAVDVNVQAGRVTSVKIAENTTGDNELETCVKRKIQTWRFPEEVSDDLYLPFALSAQ